MVCIYKITNTENGKIYIGQTRDLSKRERAYRSAAFNPRSNEYTRPIMAAIRKYGWEKFKVEVDIEFPETVSDNELNEAEIAAIRHYNSLTTGNGYNVQLGGGGCTRVPKTYEEILAGSLLFLPSEIEDIQRMLANGLPFSKVYEKYPTIKQSFLSNINTGTNFHNPALAYPLNKHSSSKFSEQEIDQIRQEIIRGDKYADIAERWGFSSIGSISMINTGKRYYSDKYSYPLCQKTKGALVAHQKKALIAKHFLIHTNLSEAEISREIGYTDPQTVRKIDKGKTHKDEKLRYPLRENSAYNSLLFKVNDVSTIPG